MQLRAIIAEDELVAREAMVKMADSCGVQVLAACRSGAEVIHQLMAFQTDLLFLDVQMPGIDGFEVLQRMPSCRLPAVIFTTAYDRYAVKAFELNAVDYLLKPFDAERFGKAVEKARSRIAISSDCSAVTGRCDREIRLSNPRQGPQRFVVRSKGKVEIVKVDDIDWIEAEHNYVRLHIGNTVHAVRQPIREIETRLQPDSFLRIHRSLIVNVDRIRSLQSCGYGEYLVVLKNGKSLPLSRNYRERLDMFLDTLMTCNHRAGHDRPLS